MILSLRSSSHLASGAAFSQSIARMSWLARIDSAVASFPATPISMSPAAKITITTCGVPVGLRRSSFHPVSTGYVTRLEVCPGSVFISVTESVGIRELCQPKIRADIQHRYLATRALG